MGELGYETDTQRWKRGNGSTAWNSLPYSDIAARIGDSTTAGRALLTAADAAAQRTALSLGNVDNTADTAKPVSTAQATSIGLKYTKPGGGIPSSDLTSGVQTSLGKADSAIQVGGDLGGTSAAPVVSKVNGVAVTGTPATGDIVKATSPTAAHWAAETGGAVGDAYTMLTTTTPMTSAVSVAVGKVNVYNASAGALGVALPALSGLTVGDIAIVEKYSGDNTSNTVTATCAGSDTFDDTTTTLVLNSAGQQRRLQVVLISATKYWKKLDGYGGGSGGTLNANLTAIGALTPGNFDMIQYRSSAYAARTLAQIKADAALDQVDNVADADKWSAAKTLTNTLLVPRWHEIVSGPTPAWNLALWDLFGITALAENITSMTSALTNMPVVPQLFWLYIVGTATRNITWGTAFEAGASALPTATSGTQRLDVGFVVNVATSKLRCMQWSSA
jgi:hypothetical protein